MHSRILRWLLAPSAAAAIFVFAACAQGMNRHHEATPPPIGSLIGLYAYDQTKPLEINVSESATADGIEVRDLSYASPTKGRVTAYLVLPRGSRPVPAVIFLPGLYGGRDDQLGEAKELAAHGAAALLLDPPHVRPGGPRLITCTARDRLPFIQYVVEVRRGIDLLAANPEIDAARIGVVGFSYGTAVASALAGIDKRLKAVVIDSGRAYNSRFFRSQCAPRLKKQKLAAYTQSLKFSDGLNYVPYAAPTSLLFQNGLQDRFTPRAEALALQSAGSEPKTVKWYSAGHELNEQAIADRTTWLESQLRFGP